MSDRMQNIIIIIIALNLLLIKSNYSFVGINLGEVSKEIKNEKGEDLNNTKILRYELRDICETEATIYYETDTNTISKIEYGLTKYNLPEQQMIISNTTKHLIKLPNLRPGKRYYYKISGITPVYDSFVTPGIVDLEIEQLGISDIQKYSAAFFFRTNLPVKGNVQYYKEDAAETITGLKWEEYSYGSRLNLENLEHSKIYYYKFEAEDTYSRKIETDWYQFMTKENNLAAFKNVKGTFTAYYNDMLGNKDEQSMLNRIVDESTDYFRGISQSNNLSETDQWVVIDLGETFPIRLVVAYWRALALPTSYKIEISVDGQNWEILKDNIDASKGFQKSADTGDNMFVSFVSGRGVIGRFVRIYVYKDAYWVKHFDWNFVQLNEVKVY